MKKEKISGKEFAWYVGGGVFAIFGLVLIVFGIIGHHMGGQLSSNFIKSAEAAVKSALNIPLDFRTWGIIFLIFGVIIFVIALNFNAKKTDRELEKSIRRQQRMNAGNNSGIEVKSAVQIVEDPITPAIETKPEEK